MSEMNLQQLKDYLKCVFELEGQLYKNQRLIDGYINKRKSDLPSKPVKIIPPAPAVPKEVDSTSCTVSSFVAAMGFGMGLFALVASLVMRSPHYDTPMGVIYFGVFLLLIGAIATYVAIMINNNNNKENELLKQKHQQVLDAYQVEKTEAMRVYDTKMQAYSQAVNKYNIDTDQQLVKFAEVKKTLQDSLDKLYSQDIIYAKYRNFVAIATIYEYFESGRCTELEGPNGAYNMYESELRSNIVICSLAQIISDLAQIKDDQYALYELINEHNQEVSSLLGDIYNEQKLTTYYAQAAAEAAEASRYATGAIFLSQAHK